MPSSGMLLRMALVRTYVSEELIASIFMVERISDLGTVLLNLKTETESSFRNVTFEINDRRWMSCRILTVMFQF
jgi:hypothetical protein